MGCRTIRTSKNREAFLKKLRSTRSITHAARAIGVGRQSVYDWRRDDLEFAKDWDEVLEATIDDLESSMMRRAIYGWREPVFHQGVICGYKRCFSNALSIFMLKANRPEKYHLEKKEARELGEASGGVMVVPAGMTPAEWVEKNAKKKPKAKDESEQ